MSNETEQLQQKIAALEQEVATLKQANPYCGIRKRSAISIGGLPLYDIAMGPNPAKGERRGHARGIIAIGDIATGVIALGGFSFGLISLGGCSIGGLALGGFAVGGIALGGA